MELSKFEKIIIVCVLILGLIGGVVLVYMEQPAIIPAVFIAMAIATLVYHFIGGIGVAEVNLGKVKMTGSIAALVGSALIISYILDEQMIKPENELQINSDYTVLNSNNKPYGRIPFIKYSYTLNSDKHIIGNDSIKLGELKFGKVSLSPAYEVTTSDSINFGKLDKKNLQGFGMFNQLRFENYSEIKYDLRLAAPFEARRDDKYWDKNTAYRSHYLGLPFNVTPVFEGERDQTLITIPETGVTYYLPLESDEQYILDDFSLVNSKIYLIRVRQIRKSGIKSLFNNFVQYQITEFSGDIE